jgi:hypothetical protein
MRWAEHVACVEEMHTKFKPGNLKRRDHMKDQSVDGRIIVKLLLNE